MPFFYTYFSLQITLIFITISIIIFPPPTHASTAASGVKPSTFRKIFAFGDSFTDTGNTKTTAGAGAYLSASNPPYGRTFFHHPTNRFSDGRLVIDFLTETLSLPYLPPYLQKQADKSHGVNFAIAGSTAIEHSFYVRNNITAAYTSQALETQLGWFQQFLESQGCRSSTTTPQQCNAVFDEALIWFGEIGVNDYAYSIGSFVSGDTTRQLAIKSATDFLQVLLSKGAKSVVVQGLPPIGCLTLSMGISSGIDRDDIGCVASVNAISYYHNNVYQARLQDLRKAFPNALIAYADYYNAYRTVMRNPRNFGFYELYSACCGTSGVAYNLNPLAPCGSVYATSCQNPSQYINWDGVHLTEAMYKAISQLFFTGGAIRPSFAYLLGQ
ncbi:GDSL-motif lipase/hydrolase family protein [Heracleum sosnowskyi]|uniref:GDSL-motif lipase/hydrolase family protein n=1 Tax=Heracleum sosnowskyi TaxID=360622 RepID=A0AAD8I161_9APIA|nr:GDSL-motif lipase/hydrolase family protein [Heracleum sosnowskyi]